MESVQALTGGGDVDAVVQLLLADCTADGLASLLACGAGDLMRAAIVCLGLKGRMSHCRVLANLLRHEDPAVVEIAENSLWRIWMRAGTDWSSELLGRAVGAIRLSRFEPALRILIRTSIIEPTFAEPYHQRGICLCFLNRLDDAAHAFRQALGLNRYHFSAAVNLGHICAERGDLRGALRRYRHALRLHPRLDGIPEVVERLKAVAGSGSRSH